MTARTFPFVRRDYSEYISGKGSHVEVISGIRRCGKSTLLKMLIDKYKKEDVAYFNFEDPRIFGFDVSDFSKLDEVIGQGKATYFFDEIQNVPQWELYVRQLHDRGEKVYITGSNASLLSKELGTRLTGRHLRHELFPFNYSEFLDFTKQKDNNSSFEDYIQNGGFPEYLHERNPEILQMLFKDIVLRDIAVRYGVKNTKTLMDLGLYLLSCVGKPVTYNSLRKQFDIGSTSSVVDYIGWLEDTYLLFLLQKFSWSPKSSAVNPRKVYAIDTGLARLNSLSFTSDNGRLLENAVYLYLRQNSEKLFYFSEKKECDFLVFKGNKCKHAIQVCHELTPENKERELNGLTEAMTFFNLKTGLIFTQNQDDVLKTEQGTVKIVSARRLLGGESLEEIQEGYS